jgi:DNA-binding response OmpR family regulator
MNGSELMEQLRAHDSLKRCFVILVTDTALSLAEKLDVLHLGIYDFLIQPIPEELVAKLRAALRHKEAEKQLLEEREQSALKTGILQAIRTFHHRVNNPLQALIMTLELMENQNVSTDANYLTRLERLKQAAQRISEIVQDFGRTAHWETTPSPGGDMIQLASPKKE